MEENLEEKRWQAESGWNRKAERNNSTVNQKNCFITINEMVENTIKNLKDVGKLAREGSTKAGKWIVKNH